MSHEAEQSAKHEKQAERNWLTTVVTRLCLNHLQLARVKRETYVGQWQPEPLVDEHASDPADTSQLANSLSLAFLVLLETLSPTERAVFILREGFDCEFADIARIVEKSEENCRRILTRARERIDERRPRFEASRADAELGATRKHGFTNADIRSATINGLPGVVRWRCWRSASRAIASRLCS